MHHAFSRSTSDETANRRQYTRNRHIRSENGSLLPILTDNYEGVVHLYQAKI